MNLQEHVISNLREENGWKIRRSARAIFVYTFIKFGKYKNIIYKGSKCVQSLACETKGITEREFKLGLKDCIQLGLVRKTGSGHIISRNSYKCGIMWKKSLFIKITRDRFSELSYQEFMDIITLAPFENKIKQQQFVTLTPVGYNSNSTRVKLNDDDYKRLKRLIKKGLVPESHIKKFEDGELGNNIPTKSVQGICETTNLARPTWYSIRDRLVKAKLLEYSRRYTVHKKEGARVKRRNCIMRLQGMKPGSFVNQWDDVIQIECNSYGMNFTRPINFTLCDSSSEDTIIPEFMQVNESSSIILY